MELKLNQTTKTLATLLGAGGAIYLIKKYIDKKAQEERDKKYGSDTAYQKAVQLRNAFNPSGVDFMINYDGTVESAVLDTVTNLANKAEWDRMVTIYMEAYKESLVDRINKELGTDDLAKFNQILQLRMAGKPVIDIITPPSPGRVTANWVGKRVRIKKGIDNYKWYATKSDIGNDTKVKTAILDLSGGKVPSSWVKDWRVSDRTTKTMRINTSTIPLSFNWITIVIEFLQIKIPVTGSTAFTYVWVNNSNWELV